MMVGELQAILLAGGEGDRLYPLTQELPKALLPIANKPLIYYSLKYLEVSGFKEVIVVLTKRIAQKVSQYLMEGYRSHGNLKIQVETVADGTDSADALRLIHNHIKTDFAVMSVDLITDVPFHNLLNIHRQHNSTVTMLLKQTATATTGSQQNASSASSTATADPMKLTEYIGISNENIKRNTGGGNSALLQSKYPPRVAFFSSSADLEDNINLKRSFLRRWQNITFSQTLFDAHLYIFSKWVSDILVAKENFTSVKHQLVPYLVMNQRFKERKDPNNILAGIPLSRIENYQKNAFLMSSAPFNQNDLIRCFAFIAPPTPAKAQPQSQQQQQTVDLYAVKRCLSLATYLEINRNIADGEIPIAKQAADTSHPSQERVIIGSDCAIGVSVEYATPDEKSQTTMKRCNVGNHCKIGKNVKLIDSVIMDHVTIGNNCTIKNSVICSDASIAQSISLTNCQVGFSYKVTDKGDYKGEMFASDRMD